MLIVIVRWPRMACSAGISPVARMKTEAKRRPRSWQRYGNPAFLAITEKLFAKVVYRWPSPCQKTNGEWAWRGVLISVPRAVAEWHHLRTRCLGICEPHLSPVQRDLGPLQATDLLLLHATLCQERIRRPAIGEGLAANRSTSSALG